MLPGPPDPTLACRRVSRDPPFWPISIRKRLFSTARPRARLPTPHQPLRTRRRSGQPCPPVAAPKRPPNPLLDRRRTCRRSQQRPLASRPRRRRLLDVNRHAPTRVVPPRRRPPRRHSTPHGCPWYPSRLRRRRGRRRNGRSRPCCLWDARRGPSYRPVPPGGAGKCSVRRNSARVSAACSPRVIDPQSSGMPGTHVMTVQVFGERSEGAPSRTGTGIGSGRRAARNGQPIRTLLNVADGQLGQVRMLVSQQIADESRGDLSLVLGHGRNGTGRAPDMAPPLCRTWVGYCRAFRTTVRLGVTGDCGGGVKRAGTRGQRDSTRSSIDSDQRWTSASLAANAGLTWAMPVYQRSNATCRTAMKSSRCYDVNVAPAHRSWSAAPPGTPK